MITKTEDRRAKRVEAVESNRKKNPVLNRNKLGNAEEQRKK